MKIITTILLISLFINTGYYGIYQIMIFRAKWNASLVRNGNKAESLFRLTLHKRKAKTFDGDEIKYKGRLFDVIKKTITRDSVTFFLYADAEEQDALTDLVNYFSPEISNLFPNSDKISLIKSFKGIPDQIITRATRFDISKKYFVSMLSLFHISDAMLTGHRLVPTPPPRHFLI